MRLYHIHMQLARSPEFPDGSRAHGYEMILPLTDEQRLDGHAWKQNKIIGAVSRFWGSEDVKKGHLRHTGHKWVIDYDPKIDGDEEPFFKLEDHKIVQGEYVSVTDTDGNSHTFLITAVTPEKT